MHEIYNIEQLAAASWPSYFQKKMGNGFLERILA